MKGLVGLFEEAHEVGGGAGGQVADGPDEGAVEADGRRGGHGEHGAPDKTAGNSDRHGLRLWNIDGVTLTLFILQLINSLSELPR